MHSPSRQNVLVGHKAVSQAVDQRAKSAMRGSRFRGPWGGSVIRSSCLHQGTEDVRPCSLKIAPNLLLGAPPVFRAGAGESENCPVRRVRLCDDLFDAVENDRSGSLKEHFFAIRIELADREASPACETAQRIGEPDRKVR